MIKPQTSAQRPSPLDSFVATIGLLTANYAAFNGLAAPDNLGPAWRDLLQDLAMARDGVLGIQTKWVRRVAMPVMRAQRFMADARNGTVQERAREAIKLLRDCQDAALMQDCMKWVRETYYVE